MNAHSSKMGAVAQQNAGGFKKWVQSRAISAKDIPGQLKLKLRQPGQNTIDEVKLKDLKRELEERERKHREKLLKKDEEDNVPQIQSDEKKEEEKPEEIPEKKKKTEDEEDDSDDELSDSDDSSDDDDDDDDELLRELEKIKKEREMEQLKREAQQRELEAKKREHDVLTGNPLLNTGLDSTVKRKWNDDVVFKNQARDEPKPKKRFINDTVRSDFHRKFLAKYIR